MLIVAGWIVATTALGWAGVRFLGHAAEALGSVDAAAQAVRDAEACADLIYARIEALPSDREFRRALGSAPTIAR